MNLRITFTRTFFTAALAVVALALTGCGKSDSGAANSSTGLSPSAASGQVKTIGVAFETLQTEFWVAAFDKLKADCAAKGITMLEGVADGDASKQFDQVKHFIKIGRAHV